MWDPEFIAAGDMDMGQAQPMLPSITLIYILSCFKTQWVWMRWSRESKTALSFKPSWLLTIWMTE